MSVPKIRVSGLDKLLREIDKQDKRLMRKHVFPAMRKALAPMRNQAKRNAAKWPSIRKLIRSKPVLTKDNDVTGKIYVAEAKDRTMQIDGRTVGFEVVANILEFGRAAPGDKGGTKVVQPSRFMRNAREQQAANVARILKLEVGRNLL